VLVIAGNLTLDDTVLPDGRTAMGALGGDVLYSALGAALWDRCIGLFSRIGNDVPPERLTEIQAAGLDIRGLRPYPGPTIRYWVIYEWDGRRHFIFRTLEERFTALSPEPHDLPAEYAEEAQAVHVAAMPFGHVERLVRMAAALPARPLVTLDTHEDFVAGYQDRLAAMLPLLAAFLPSREEVTCWFGDDDPERRIGDLLALGPGIVVVKMGADGVLIQERGASRPTHVPAVPATVCDVTGAGDAFCGGFVARLVDGGDAVEAACAGAVSASFAVESFGTARLFTVTREERDQRLVALLARCRGGR